MQNLIAGCVFMLKIISKNMFESSELKLCRLCGCDNDDNVNIFDEGKELLIKLRTTFSLVVSIFHTNQSHYRF